MTLGSWLADGGFWGHSGSKPGARLGEMRFWVLDIDITGTDIRHDTVYGLAALPVEGAKFSLSDLLYLPVSDGPEAAPAPGEDWRDGYTAIRERVSSDPVVTYNRTFVRFMLDRACGRQHLPPLQGEWLDLADAFAGIGAGESEVTTMSYWLARMRSGGPHPHDATYDVFAMAQMLLAVIAYSEDAGIDTLESLARNRTVRAWLRGPEA